MKRLTRGRPIRSQGGAPTHVELPGLGRARIAAGLSQRALAERSGLSEHSLRGWERMHRRAPKNVLPLIAEALGVSVARLRRA